MNRQTGITSEQMATAPRGATFVWCNEALHYPRTLAAKLDRQDLHIISPNALRTGLCGSPRRVVVDHACRLGHAAAYEVCIHNARLPRANTDNKEQK